MDENNKIPILSKPPNCFCKEGINVNCQYHINRLYLLENETDDPYGIKELSEVEIYCYMASSHGFDVQDFFKGILERLKWPY